MGTFIGTLYPDDLTGTDFNDTLDGLYGSDSLSGGDGDDTMVGGPSADTLSGGQGRDVVNSSEGTDDMDSGPGNDTIAGFAGDDMLSADGGSVTFYIQVVAGGLDLVTGFDADDTLYFFSPGWAALSSTLRSGDAASGLLGGQVMVGTLSEDRTRIYINVDSVAGADVVADLQGSFNLGYFSGLDDWEGFRLRHFELPQPPLPSASSGDNTLTGSDGDDTVNALAGNETLQGGADNNTLRGCNGNDNLDGGDRVDLLQGGLGNNIYIFDANFGFDDARDYEYIAGDTDTFPFTSHNLADLAFSRAGDALRVVDTANLANTIYVNDWHAAGSSGAFVIESRLMANGDTRTAAQIEGPVGP